MQTSRAVPYARNVPVMTPKLARLARNLLPSPSLSIENKKQLMVCVAFAFVFFVFVFA